MSTDDFRTKQVPCGSGFYADHEGSAVCQACQPGRFSNDTVNAACEKCEFGTYQEMRGQTQCKLCEGGGFADEAGLSRCKFCKLWQFQEAEGISVKCTFCYSQERMYGFNKPDECIKVPAVVLGTVALGLYLLKQALKFWACCRYCCPRKQKIEQTVEIRMVDHHGNPVDPRHVQLIPPEEIPREEFKGH
jgi:hypothetical protein